MKASNMTQGNAGFYKSILDNLNSAIWLNRADGTALWQNEKVKEFLEHSVDELNEIGLETYAKEFFHPDDQYIFEESLSHLFDINIGHFTAIYRQKDKHGDWIKILATSKVVKRDSKGFPLELLNCGIIVSDEMAPFSKIESLLKENLILKNKVKLSILSKREIDILKCIAQGKQSKDIAEEKYISVHTVDTHRRNMLNKLELRNTADLVRLATECGLY